MYLNKLRFELDMLLFFRAGCNVHATSGCLRKNAMANAAYAGDQDVFELLSNQGGSRKLPSNDSLNIYINILTFNAQT